MDRQTPMKVQLSSTRKPSDFGGLFCHINEITLSAKGKKMTPSKSPPLFRPFLPT